PNCESRRLAKTVPRPSAGLHRCVGGEHCKLSGEYGGCSVSRARAGAGAWHQDRRSIGRGDRGEAALGYCGPKGRGEAVEDFLRDGLRGFRRARRRRLRTWKAAVMRKPWDRAEQAIVGVLGLAALAIALWQVLSRYFFPHESISYAEEVMVYLLIWAIM